MVAPHMQTNPNNTRNDNFSTHGNFNPYTGTEGTKPRDGEGLMLAPGQMPLGAPDMSKDAKPNGIPTVVCADGTTLQVFNAEYYCFHHGGMSGR